MKPYSSHCRKYISMFPSSRVVHLSSSNSFKIRWPAVVKTATLSDGHILAGSAPPIAQHLHTLHHGPVALSHLAKNYIIVVQVRSQGNHDGELTVVSVPPRVGHGEQANLVVLNNKVFIFEHVAVDGLAAPAVPAGDVAALQHELRDDPVEGGLGVTKTLLPSAERTEVLRGPGNDVIVELKLDPARILAININVKIYNGPGSRGQGRQDQEEQKEHPSAARSSGQGHSRWRGHVGGAAQVGWTRVSGHLTG